MRPIRVGHRRQLDATRALITTAEARGQARLAESNRTVEKNLLRIINALDAEKTPCCGTGNGCACSGQEASTHAG